MKMRLCRIESHTHKANIKKTNLLYVQFTLSLRETLYDSKTCQYVLKFYIYSQYTKKCCSINYTIVTPAKHQLLNNCIDCRKCVMIC